MRHQVIRGRGGHLGAMAAFLACDVIYPKESPILLLSLIAGKHFEDCPKPMLFLSLKIVIFKAANSKYGTGVLTLCCDRSDTNQAVHPQKMTRGLKK